MCPVSTDVNDFGRYEIVMVGRLELGLGQTGDREGMIMIMRGGWRVLGLSVVAGDNDHFRRQLVLEVVRARQAVAGAVPPHIHHLVSGPGHGLPSSLSV